MDNKFVQLIYFLMVLVIVFPSIRYLMSRYGLPKFVMNLAIWVALLLLVMLVYKLVNPLAGIPTDTGDVPV